MNRPGVPRVLGVQAETRVLRAHALDGQLAQCADVAVGDFEVGRSADLVHRLPPPAGVARAQLGLGVADKRAVQVLLRLVALDAETIALNDHLVETEPGDGGHDQDGGRHRRRQGRVAPIPAHQPSQRANPPGANRLVPQITAQVAGQFASALVATHRLLRHRFQADRLQVGWDRRSSQVRRRGFLVEHLEQQIGPLALERHGPAKQLVQEHAQAVDVGSTIDALVQAAGLLGRHIGGCSQDVAFLGQGRLHVLVAGQAKVRQQRLVVPVQQNVRRLDVAMDDAHLMGVIQCVGNLRRPPGRLHGGRLRFLEQRGEVRTGHEIVNQVGQIAFLSDFEERNNGGMPQLGRCPGLAQKPLPARVPGSQPRTEHFEGHDAPQPRVFGPKDDAHAPLPEYAQDAINSQPADLARTLRRLAAPRRRSRPGRETFARLRRR